jgi:transposase
VCDGDGKPLVMLLTEGQMSDHKGARLMLGALPAANALPGDRGYDSNWFRAALAEKGIEASIPSSRSRKVEIPHDKTLYRQRHKIENMFGRLKDWRRIATRYDRCANNYMSAVALVAAVISWT